MENAKELLIFVLSIRNKICLIEKECVSNSAGMVLWILVHNVLGVRSGTLKCQRIGPPGSAFVQGLRHARGVNGEFYYMDRTWSVASDARRERFIQTNLSMSDSSKPMIYDLCQPFYIQSYLLQD